MSKRPTRTKKSTTTRKASPQVKLQNRMQGIRDRHLAPLPPIPQNHAAAITRRVLTGQIPSVDLSGGASTAADRRARYVGRVDVAERRGAR